MTNREFPKHVIKQDTSEVCFHWHSFCKWLRLNGCCLEGWPDRYDAHLFDVSGVTYCTSKWIQAGWVLLKNAFAEKAVQKLELTLIAHRWIINDLEFRKIGPASIKHGKVYVGFDEPTFWLSDRSDDLNIYCHYEHLRGLFTGLVPGSLIPASYVIEEQKPAMVIGLGIGESGYLVQNQGIEYLFNEIANSQGEIAQYVHLVVSTAVGLLDEFVNARRKQSRPTLDEYYMNLAHAAKSRATCGLKQVGAVLVKDNQVISTGYNGSLPGAQECSATCLQSFNCAGKPKVSNPILVDANCQITRTKSNGKTTLACNTIHAEVNAIFQCINRGVSVKGATLYVTFAPCIDCCKISALSGVSRIVFDEPNGYVETHKHFQDFVKIEQINEKDNLTAKLAALL